MRVRVLEVGDFDAYFDVRTQAFGQPTTDRAAWTGRIQADGDALALGAFVDGHFVGGLRVLPGGQWMGGRSVPMGGVAAVVVRPEMRGRGVARALLVGALDWMREVGIAVSALHPASTRVYRSAGWEIAGEHGVCQVPARSLTGIRTGAELPVDRLGPADWPAVRDCYARVAPAVHGYVDRSESYWALREPAADDDGSFTYGVRDGDGLRGYARYRQRHSRGWGYHLMVEECLAVDVDAAASLWRFLGAHSMQVEQIEVAGFHEDNLVMLLDEQDLRLVAMNRWMHRIVDLPSAIAARGFAPDARGAVTISVHDPWSGGSSGDWTIEVQDGSGTASRARRAAGDISIDIGALSALNIGRFSTADLGSAGRLRGDADTVARLGSMMAAPRPAIADDF